MTFTPMNNVFTWRESLLTYLTNFIRNMIFVNCFNMFINTFLELPTDTTLLFWDFYSSCRIRMKFPHMLFHTLFSSTFEVTDRTHKIRDLERPIFCRCNSRGSFSKNINMFVPLINFLRFVTILSFNLVAFHMTLTFNRIISE